MRTFFAKTLKKGLAVLSEEITSQTCFCFFNNVDDSVDHYGFPRWLHEIAAKSI